MNWTMINSKGFSDAVMKISKAESLPAKDKLKLIKLRKSISSHLEDLKEVLDTLTDEAEATDLMKNMVNFDFDPIDVNVVIDILNADDILILSGTILTEV